MSRKIFIDTNKYLDFYRYKEENLEILNKLENCNDIVITEQVVDEFRRNRNKELYNLKEHIHELNVKINNKIFNIEPIGIYSERIKHINMETSEKVQEIKSEITSFEEFLSEIISSTQEDIINSTFFKILENTNTIVYKHNDLCYQRAVRRNSLGGLPRSEKSGFRSLTICDEYIWETLLNQSKYDICFVTRDRTYLDNQGLLENEYYEKTGKKIIFVDTISEGLAYLGTNVSQYASEVEHINNYDLMNPQEQLVFDSNIDKISFNSVQQDIFNMAISLAKEAIVSRTKKVLIVSASTGCGKTSLATSLLVDFVEHNYKTTFVTRNSVSRNLFYEKLKGKYRSDYIRNLFSSSSAFIEARPNAYDCLIVDDAHRLQSKSGLFHNLGENQIKEIIKASLFSVFFIDEYQRVTFNDIGTIDLIKKYSEDFQADVCVKTLTIPYRFESNGGYLIWLNHILDNSKLPSDFHFSFDFRVFDNPNDLRNLIIEKNKENGRSRMLAGYCWDWISSGKNDPNVYDVVIPEYNFEMSWNVSNSKTWSIDPESIHEIGCIHMVQGLEFDFVGVIIGQDMKFHNHKIVTDYTKRAKTDQSLKGINKKMRENKEKALAEADILIKNTYRTLMTRGVKGCYVYCMNKELNEYLKQQILCYNNYSER